MSVDPTLLTTDATPRRAGVLDLIERVGNKLPDPTTLFIIGALLVMVLSQVGVAMGWSVQPVRPTAVSDGAGGTVLELVPVGEPIRAVGLLSSDGFFWAMSSMVTNFINFPPLGIVLTGMLGVGVAERTGLMGALLKWLVRLVPNALLTPMLVFVGVNASLATDAGYIVLPPLAMALYKSVGRSPLAGLAAAFAGLAGGFNANLLVTSLDPLLAGLSTSGAQIIDPEYVVAPTCNWWFMIASTFMLTFVGWGVTAWLVEPRLRRKPPAEGGPAAATESDRAEQALTAGEKTGLIAAAAAFAATIGAVLAMTLIPGAPLHGQGARFDRWIEVIVPIIFFAFILPGVAFGIAAGTLRSERDFAKALVDTMASIAPIIVLAFFAAQFIAYFNRSNLGAMLATLGGQELARRQMSPEMLMVLFVLVTMTFNLLMASMSAKYTLFAPIFVPMFMMVGISPELTQAAYRIGDSVTNIITPMNTYLIIILVFMRKHAANAGMGTLISLMVPYTVVFTIVWLALLLAWMQGGWELGPGGPLEYRPE